MTVYGLNYRSEARALEPRWRRLVPLVRLEFGTLFRSKWGIVAFLFCLISALVRLVAMLVQMGILDFGPGRRGSRLNNVSRGPSELAQFDPWQVDFYLEPVLQPGEGLVPMLILTALVTARAIAKDRTTFALELYWTRGITPGGYCLAKWAGSFLLVAMATAGASTVLWLTGVLIAEDWSFLTTTIGFAPRAIAALLVFAAMLTGLCILCSAIAGSANLAAICWCLLLMVSSAVGAIVANFTGNEALAARCSIWEATAVVARHVAGVAPRRSDLGGALVLLGVVGLVLGLLARRRLRLQEALT